MKVKVDKRTCGPAKFAAIRRLLLVVICGLFGSAHFAQATTIDFGVSWPTFTSVNTGAYSSDPLDRVLAVASANYGPEAAIAAYVNSVLGTTYDALDVVKTSAGGLEVNPPDGYLVIPSGWTYVVLQYGGPTGTAMIIELDGNGAQVPFDSALISGSGDKFGMSHFSVIGPTSTSVPDGGATVLLLGCAFMGLAAFRHALVKA